MNLKKNIGAVQFVPEYTEFLHSFFSSLHSEYSELLQYNINDWHRLNVLILSL
jgi:hypothetical protein